jgi:Ran GTPase-activating protein 1
MHNNGLGPEGARKLGNAIEKCFENSGRKLSLKVFVCGRNRLEYGGCKAISSALKLCGTLEEIQMPQNGIRPDAIEFIAEAISFNKNLKIINLNDNTFRASGGKLMSKSINQLKQIEFINFGDCLLKSDGALHIAKALADNKCLKEIILCGNQIDATTGLDIAKLLLKNKKINNNLSLIDLNANNFGADTLNEIKYLLKPFGSALGSFR